MNLMPENVSTYGGEIDSLGLLITVLVGFSLAVALGIFFYSLIRFRRKPGQKATYIAGSSWKQFKWVAIPVLIVVAMDFYIDLKTTDAWELIKGTTPKADLRVRITGQQYSWIFTYADVDGQYGSKDEVQETGEFHVPVGKNIVFDLEAKDVLHSFWVPSLRLKQDAVPGRTITGWFQATKIGEYDIGCAQICGVGHTVMHATLVVQSQEDFDQWLKNANHNAENPSSKTDSASANGNNTDLSALAESGKKLVQTKGCLACHSTDGSRLVGPTYKGIFGRKSFIVSDGQEKEIDSNEAYLRRSILDPQSEVVKDFPPAMPPQRANVTDDDVNAIIEYLKSVK